MLKRAIGRGCRAAPATKSTAQQPDQRTTSNVGTRRSGTTSPLRRLWARLQNVDLDLLRPDLFCLQELHLDRKSTRLNSSHLVISYAVFCLKKKKYTSRKPAVAE